MRRYIAAFGAGVGLGYVLGARAGRQRYEDLKTVAGHVAEHPITQSAGSMLHEQAQRVETVVAEKLSKSQDAAAEADPYAGDPEHELDKGAAHIAEAWADAIDGTEADLQEAAYAGDPEHELDKGAAHIAEAWADSIDGTEDDLRAAEKAGS